MFTTYTGKRRRSQRKAGVLFQRGSSFHKVNGTPIPQYLNGHLNSIFTKTLLSSQVGIIIHGTTIETTVMGGPAYNSKQIDPGDVILRVDGENATADNIKDLLVGEDLPGSSVTIAVAKGGPQVQNIHRRAHHVGLHSSLFATPAPGNPNQRGCVPAPNLHTTNETHPHISKHPSGGWDDEL